MRRIAQTISWIALVATLVPAFAFFFDGCTLEQVKQWMLWATVVWFVATPFWMGREKSPA
jgi:hypothetical protein